MPESAPLVHPGFRIAYAAAGAHPTAGADAFVPGAPWLGGAGEEPMFAGAKPSGSAGPLQLYESGGLLVGQGRVACTPGRLGAATHALYQQVFAALAGRRLYRVWHYVPRINAEEAGIENYRAFCQGRSLAFEQQFGPDYRRQMCAASAVGSDADELALLFVAGTESPRHFENPEQVPAYEYPAEHGPRPPSFARATVATVAGREHVFVSGTSSIKGHRTVGGSLAQQFECTLDNLRLVSRACGLGDDLQLPRPARRYLKIYLRRAEDLPETRRLLDQSLVRPADHVTYLRADICRAALDLEVEATLLAGA